GLQRHTLRRVACDRARGHSLGAAHDRLPGGHRRDPVCPGPHHLTDAPMSEKRSEHWPNLFRTASEPVFLLDGRRRLLFANPAWEALTGLSFADARGEACKRVARPETSEPWRLVLAALEPPAEVLEGRSASARRR